MTLNPPLGEKCFWTFGAWDEETNSAGPTEYWEEYWECSEVHLKINLILGHENCFKSTWVQDLQTVPRTP